MTLCILFRLCTLYRSGWDNRVRPPAEAQTATKCDAHRCSFIAPRSIRRRCRVTPSHDEDYDTHKHDSQQSSGYWRGENVFFLDLGIWDEGLVRATTRR